MGLPKYIYGPSKNGGVYLVRYDYVHRISSWDDDEMLLAHFDFSIYISVVSRNTDIEPMIESVEICWHLDADSEARLLPVRGDICTHNLSWYQSHPIPRLHSLDRFDM